MKNNIAGKINLTKFFSDVLSIFVGVLLAFSVSEWQEERKEKEVAQYAMVDHYKLPSSGTRIRVAPDFL